MNKAVKILLVLGLIILVLGLFLTVVGFGLGGFKTIHLAPGGSYVIEDIRFQSAASEKTIVNSFSEINAETFRSNIFQSASAFFGKNRIK